MANYATSQQPVAASLPSTLILADASTTQAPDELVLRHTSSGTAAAGFGGTFAVELQSAAGNIRRVMTDVTDLTTATDGAEVARRTISLMKAGSLVSSLVLVMNSGGALTVGAGTLNVTDAGSLAVILLHSGATPIGAIRSRTSAVGMEYVSAIGEHVFYTGLMAASSPFFKVNPSGVAFFGVAVAAQQVSAANLTNSVTAGGTTDTIANYTDLTTYANDSAAIRNDIYQLARKLKQVNDALRLYGLLT